MSPEKNTLDEEVEAASADLLIRLAFAIPAGDNKTMLEIGDAIVRYKNAVIARERSE